MCGSCSSLVLVGAHYGRCWGRVEEGRKGLWIRWAGALVTGPNAGGCGRKGGCGTLGAFRAAGGGRSGLIGGAGLGHTLFPCLRAIGAVGLWQRQEERAG